MTGSGFRNVAAALKHRDYALYTYAHLPGLVFMWAQRIGIGWLAWELTHSPAWLGIIAMADLLPAVFISPFAGALADRVNVIRLFMVTQGVVALHSGVLWLFTALGMMDIWLLFALAVLLGFYNPFGNAARHNTVPLLVPLPDLPPAIALNAICFNVARSLGPAMAGGLIAWSGRVAEVFALSALAELVLLVAICFFRTTTTPRQHNGGGIAGMVKDVRDGFGYVIGHRGIGPVLLLLVFAAVTARPSLELLPGFADQVFARGAEGLGWLGAAVGVGGILGSIWLAWRGGIAGLASIVVLHTFLMAFGMLVFAMAGPFWLALAFLTLVGFSFNVSGVGTQTLVQYAVDPAMRGRTMSIFMLIFRGMPALGALLIGVAAEFLGLQWAVGGAAAICVAGCIWAYGRRAVMTRWLERPGKPESGGS